jgi:HJR/Mrr/RecB family endonuclease
MVTISPRRIAVAAVSGINPFHPAAVQQTLNELAQHGTDASAIITNSRLTSGSRELAAHRRCTLIGESEFPDFVLGKTGFGNW